MGRGAEHIKLAIHLELQDGDSVSRSLIRPCHRGPFSVSSNGGGAITWLASLKLITNRLWYNCLF
ncbi:hypothetical protein CASFOL_021372 [Castilleja foliolosa]|uniref:Uncharacterized protein n=1 Tax=Castilleja foliolosa TaxID=1961234 RepID=A0ABD3CWD2_9LAMI